MHVKYADMQMSSVCVHVQYAEMQISSAVCAQLYVCACIVCRYTNITCCACASVCVCMVRMQISKCHPSTHMLPKDNARFFPQWPWTYGNPHICLCTVPGEPEISL